MRTYFYGISYVLRGGFAHFHGTVDVQSGDTRLSMMQAIDAAVRGQNPSLANATVLNFELAPNDLDTAAAGGGR
jgi:hypothetical protein